MQLFVRLSTAFLVFATLACKSENTEVRSSPEDASFPLFDMSTKSEQARNYMTAGERASDRGRDLDAIKAFRHAVAADSAYAFGYLRVAQKALSLDEYNVNLRRAIAYKSTGNPVEQMMIDAEEANFRGDRDSAIHLMEKLTSEYPSHPRAWLALANAYLQANRISDLRKTMDKVIALAPKYGLGYELAAQDYTFSEPRDFAKARQYLDQAMKIWPNEPYTWDYLGDYYRAQNKLDSAAVAYGRAIELNPKESEEYSQRGHTYTFLGKSDLARADYDAATRYASENGAAFIPGFRALVPAYEGNFARSIKELEELYQAVDGMNVPEPVGQKLIVVEGISYLGDVSGDLAAADSANVRFAALVRQQEKTVNTPEFERASEASIEFVEGLTAVAKGNIALARQKAAKMIQLRAAEKNPTRDFAAHALLAAAALAAKDYPAVLRESKLGSPNSPCLWYMKAQALQAMGQKAEARMELQKVATYNFNNSEYASCRYNATKLLNSLQ